MKALRVYNVILIFCVAVLGWQCQSLDNEYSSQKTSSSSAETNAPQTSRRAVKAGDWEVIGLNRFYVVGEEARFYIKPLNQCKGDSMPIAFAEFDSELNVKEASLQKLFLTEGKLKLTIANDSIIGPRAFGVNGFCFQGGQIEGEYGGDFTWFIVEKESIRDSLIQIHGNDPITIVRK